MAKQLSSSMANHGSTSARVKSARTVYISSIEIENIRCFGPRQKLNLTKKNGNPAQWTIILGNNGTGKTTLLQALSLAKVQFAALTLTQH